jgi:phage terminase large subunit
MIHQTTALRKIASLNKKIRIVRGGQGAAKTISILILLINHAASKPDKEILIISEELTKMRLTVIKDFIKIMKQIGIFEETRFLAETLYKFPNGSFIKFIGLDKADIGKGLRCDVAFFNEVNKIDIESYRQIASRAKFIYADYNPDAEFFIDTEILKRNDCDFLQLTFNDNELLSNEERAEILMYKDNGYNPDGSIKNAYWANLWNVYGLGNIGNLQGVVFENWDIVDCLPIDINSNVTVELIAVGLDFGFTNDPTAIISVYRKDNELWVDELLYETKLINSDIIARFRTIGVDKYIRIIADSAEPKSIEEISRAGYNIEGAKKGQDSIRSSIDTLQKFRIHITSRSINLIKELRAYRWIVDKSGKSLNEPIDRDNHAIDALRYVALNKLASHYEWDIY